MCFILKITIHQYYTAACLHDTENKLNSIHRTYSRKRTHSSQRTKSAQSAQSSKGTHSAHTKKTHRLPHAGLPPASTSSS